MNGCLTGSDGDEPFGQDETVRLRQSEHLKLGIESMSVYRVNP